jgi:hypothetical protein
MPTTRTSLNLRKYDVRRLTAHGYEIRHIQTRHHDDGDETEIVWDPAVTAGRNPRTRAALLTKRRAGPKQGPAAFACSISTQTDRGQRCTDRHPTPKKTARPRGK